MEAVAETTPVVNVSHQYDEMVAWARGPNISPSLIAEGRWSRQERDEANQTEQIWGNWIIGDTDNGQWTTRLGENLVKCAYEKKGKKVWRPKCINRYRPDWETEDEIIEVKTRNWTTSGTAGEKVLGVPFKYSDVPRLYGKPLRIVCVAYQEWELAYGSTRVFGDDISEEKKMMLKLWKGLGIEFVRFTDICS